MNSEIGKKEINNGDFINTTTKEEKDNCIYNKRFIEYNELLNIEQKEELIDNKNSMNYISTKKKKKQKLKIINNINDFEQFYGKSKETLFLNT